MSTVDILKRINGAIINPVILLLFSVATLVFFWGIFKFIANNSDDTERSKGKSAILWGLVGMFIMVSAFGIIQFILSNIGVTPSFPF